MKWIARLRHEARLLLVALQFLTRLPLPKLKAFQPEWLELSARYFPLTGFLIGLATAAVFAALSFIFNPWVAAIGSTLFSILLTGAFHEDGLADTCDGLGGSFTREGALQIMKDSRLGTYGTLGLVMALALKVALLASLPLETAVVALLLGHSVSRLGSLLLLLLLDYAGDPEHAKAKPLATRLNQLQLIYASALLLPPLLLTFILLPFPGWKPLALSGLLMLLASLYMARLLKRKLGGHTGDGLGATQQLTEIACYLGIAAL
ncbi:adenosylcobinamide-GDP ribazoletransferase [Marinospirillum perlucidum]|uniref:adenosylcobinamide-GDP ribazoletransferase n=1 Tax=Marinospirillum perlucidum TaxID=1982602 RepID=UPI000DF45E52|nr:adenosylcobinamide-GDP ribazoletransferase [Marinospirillum perlucidum]